MSLEPSIQVPQHEMAIEEPTKDTRPKDTLPNGAPYLIAERTAESPPPPVRNETPAVKHMRERFLPKFMKLKQPAIPGIWGSWDPQEGQPIEPASDWPDFDLRDEAIQAHLPKEGEDGTRRDEAQVQTQADKAEAPSTPPTVWPHQSSRRFHVLACLPEVDVHDSSYFPAEPSISALPCTPAAALPTPVSNEPLPSNTPVETNAASPAPEPTITSSAAVPSIINPTALLPNTNSKCSLGDIANFSAPFSKHPAAAPSPRLFNPDTDLDKDSELKQVSAEAQRTYTGVMWGVAAPPPVTFSREEVVSMGDVLGGDAEQPLTDGDRDDDEANASIRAEQDHKTADRVTDKGKRKEVGEERQQRYGWFSQGAIWAPWKEN